MRPKMYFYILFTIFSLVYAGNDKADFKNQFCTDPRTFKKHPAYSEWADAYSCTRHRCQPGGRSLAIYTVGCKRVEPPEAAIECEEVVEDTNMQFPFCCTRLRCLVIVRGEVWTKVLGQPWENLPAAPWSHMYKMKRPPPAGQAFLPKDVEGPVYQLMTESPNDKKLRSSLRAGNDPDCPECMMRARGTRVSPDIVIALTAGDDKNFKRNEDKKNKVIERTSKSEEDSDLEKAEAELDEKRDLRELKPDSDTKEQRTKEDKDKKEPRPQHSQPQWTEIPQNQWVDNDSLKQGDSKEPEPEKSKASQYNLQSLVDAISTRMRDIENVVQKMSEKVTESGNAASNRKEEEEEEDDESRRAQMELMEDTTTEASIEDNMSALYANNKIVTRRKPPTEPSQFMAPIETGKKSDKRRHHKKHVHGNRIHKKARRNKKLKKDMNTLSLEDSRMS